MKRITNFDWYLPAFPKGASEAVRRTGLDAHWFSLDHWWRGLEVGELTREAAIYELLRRHPRIGVERAKLEYPAGTIRAFDAFKGYNEYSAIRLIEVLIPTCPKTWPKLDSQDRHTFIETLEKTDLGKFLAKPLDTPLIAKSQTPGKHAEADAHIFAIEFIREIIAMDKLPEKYIPPPTLGRKNPFSALYSALRKGRLVLSVDVFEEHDPQAYVEKMAQLYQEDFKRHSKKVQTRRTNIQSILNIIQIFEDSEIQRLLRDEPKKVNMTERMNFQKLFNGITPLESKEPGLDSNPSL